MQQLASDDLRPQSPGGLGRGAVLALLVHGLLIVGLAVGVNWRTHEPEGVTAELWAAVPQSAAPAAVEPPPQPTPPQPTPPQPQPQPKAVEPPPQQADRDAEIAIEKAREDKKRKDEQDRQREQERQAKAQKEREEREREAKEQAAKDKLAKEREAKEKDAKAKAEQQKQQQLADDQKRKKAEEARLAQIREENLKRMQGMIGGTGAPGSTGTAQQSAGPSASYGGRIIARVRPNIVFTDDVPGNPEAVVEVKAAPDGSIVGRRLVQSSGVKAWDDAVLRAIDRTDTLPRDTDGRVPSSITIVFRRN